MNALYVFISNIFLEGTQKEFFLKPN